MTEDLTGTLRNKCRMARAAVPLQNPAVLFTDLNGFFEISEREGQRMVPSVFRLRDVLAQTGLREMALRAGRHVMMTGRLPGLKLLVHDMTVDAGFGPRGKIGKAFGILKGKNAQADRRTKKKKKHEHEPGKLRHELTTIYRRTVAAQAIPPDRLSGQNIPRDNSDETEARGTEILPGKGCTAIVDVETVELPQNMISGETFSRILNRKFIFRSVNKKTRLKCVVGASSGPERADAGFGCALYKFFFWLLKES